MFGRVEKGEATDPISAGVVFSFVTGRGKEINRTVFVFVRTSFVYVLSIQHLDKAAFIVFDHVLVAIQNNIRR